MDFNTTTFLFVFIPLFFTAFFIIKPDYRKWLILIASVILYAWFQKSNILVLLGFILVNYLILWFFQRRAEKGLSTRLLFIGAITGNLLMLLFFRLFTSENWFSLQFATRFPDLTFFKTLTFPVGLSFIVFQVLSVLIDTNRAQGKFSGNLWDYLNYLLMFPKITMGPITRFGDIQPQLSNLNITSENVLAGTKRFIIGLAKKVIIADQLAVIVNAGFGLEKPAFPTSIAWLLIVAFLIQIYYDFSGYIDMGIGLARIVGLKLPENFNSPYSALSLSDFWRRWHMTLTSWFRDYLFYPLEFRRRKTKRFRTESNTILVFVLTGLWHGLTFNYFLWGLLQGVIISFENSRYGKWIKSIPTVFQRLYFLAVILVSWAVFRSESIGYTLRFFKRLVIIDQSVQLYPFAMSQPLPIINNSVYLVLGIGIIGLLPLRNIWSSLMAKRVNPDVEINPILVFFINVLYIVVFIITIAVLASQNFMPSIYGKY